MLSLGASGTYLALLKPDLGSILNGVFTFYLVATAWMTARRKDSKAGVFDWAALLVALAVGGSHMTFGFQAALSLTGSKGGYPAVLYFVFGSLALLAATGDLRMLARGSISGGQRLARHLWRMCFALFIAAGSLFLARQQIFPAFMRETGTLYLLSFLPLILMIFWLIRIRFAKAYRKTAAVSPAYWYLPVKKSAGPRQSLVPAPVLFLLTIAMGAGIFSVGMAAYQSRKSIADTLSATIASSGIEQAARQYHDLKAAAPAAYNFAENELNALGYQLVRANRLNEAIRIFQLNAEAYPHSSNVYDSLAEAYMDNGNKPQAIVNYQRSLQLNPENRNATLMLQKLRAP